MNSLYDISKELRNVYNQLESGEGIDENGEISQEMQNALLISEQNLQLKGVDYGYVIKSFGNEIDLYDKEIKRLTEEKKRLQKIQDNLINRISTAMHEFGIIEIDGTTIGKPIKLSFRKSESVEITDIKMIPDEYKRVKITSEPDKVFIKQALKDGKIVEGARLVEKDNLQIK